ncbi:MAG: hypothetical protein CL388_08880 [Acidiferrobacteraceae bacterium]|jgi:hypothetical protein|nr:hypothetical protein [Acidiferrobacteraceae bacterium]
MNSFGEVVFATLVLPGWLFFMWRTARWVRFATDFGGDFGFLIGFFLAPAIFFLVAWPLKHLLFWGWALILGIAACVLVALAMWHWEKKNKTLYKSPEDTYP